MNKMPKDFEEFTAAIEREHNLMATPMDYIKVLHTVVANLIETVDQLGKPKGE